MEDKQTTQAFDLPRNVWFYFSRSSTVECNGGREGTWWVREAGAMWLFQQVCVHCGRSTAALRACGAFLRKKGCGREVREETGISSSYVVGRTL